jgi:adenylate cyclase
MNKNRIAFLLSSGILLFMFLLQGADILTQFEESVLDLKFVEFEREVPADKVSIAYIDEKSLNSFQENHGILWPWPRDVYSIVHNYLMAKGARMVVYDIIFDQPGFNQNQILGADGDSLFALVLTTFGNGIMSTQTTEGSTIKTLRRDILIPTDIPLDSTVRYSVANLPTPTLLNAAAGVGSVAVPSSGESVIRSVPLFFNINNEGLLPGLSVSAYMVLNQIPYEELEFYPEGRPVVQFGENEIPVGEHFNYLINWYETIQPDDESFENTSYYGLFKAALEYSQLGEAQADSLIDVEGKVVFLGSNAAGLSDIKSTPMSAAKAMPGVEIHATILNNLLEKDYISRLPFLAKEALILLIVVSLVLIILNLQSRVNIPLTFLIFCLIAGSGFYLFSEFRYWIPTFELLFSGFLTAFVTYSAKYVNESYQRRKIRGAFDLYVQKELVDEVLEKPEMLKLGGQRKEITVMFSDLAGFTSISEQKEPEELVSFLNLYLSEMTGIILSNKGTLDKYIGDAIMAFWGAPIDIEEHAYLACKSVLEMEQKLKDMSEQLTRSGMPYPLVRYGMNTGAVVVGNMGSAKRFSYTVMGDNVNLAARLEPANKIFGTKILISQATRDLVEQDFLTREVALLQVKGKQQPMRIFELQAFKEEAGESLTAFNEEYHKALEHFYGREWDGAENSFTKAKQILNGDSVCNLYLEQIQSFRKTPPPADWSGVLEQKTK